jgi:hypothetical protein
MVETLVPRSIPRLRIAGVGALAFLAAATVLLWACYGTAVFLETIRAGFVACFG